MVLGCDGLKSLGKRKFTCEEIQDVRIWLSEGSRIKWSREDLSAVSTRHTAVLIKTVFLYENRKDLFNTVQLTRYTVTSQSVASIMFRTRPCGQLRWQTLTQKVEIVNKFKWLLCSRVSFALVVWKWLPSLVSVSQNSFPYFLLKTIHKFNSFCNICYVGEITLSCSAEVVFYVSNINLWGGSPNAFADLFYD